MDKKIAAALAAAAAIGYAAGEVDIGEAAARSHRAKARVEMAEPATAQLDAIVVRALCPDAKTAGMDCDTEELDGLRVLLLRRAKGWTGTVRPALLPPPEE